MAASRYSIAEAGRPTGWDVHLRAAMAGDMIVTARFHTSCGGWLTVELRGLRVSRRDGTVTLANRGGDLLVDYGYHHVQAYGEAIEAVRALRHWLQSSRPELEGVSECGGRARRAR